MVTLNWFIWHKQTGQGLPFIYNIDQFCKFHSRWRHSW